MRIGLLQDGAPNEAGRFAEMVEEAVLAEEMGFDFYGLAETHFTWFGTSAPEVLFGAVATRTQRMRLRSLSTVLLSFNHPIRVAERAATIDCLSGGRFEIGTARSNQLETLQAFGIEPSQTVGMWSESLQVIAQALSQDTFEFHGENWDIPPRSIYPRPLQSPHPPLFVAATSIDGCRRAGENGIGVIAGNSLGGGWDYVAEGLAAYREGLQDAKPPAGVVNNSFASFSIKAHCAETSAQAKEEAREQSLKIVDQVMKMWARLAPTSPDYAYMNQLAALEDRKDDLDFLIERSPYISVGDPDFFVERFKQVAALGVDEFIVAIDGLDHEKHMRAIELLGRHVLPEFRRSSAGVASSS